MKIHIPTLVTGIIIILVGFFQLCSSSQRNTYIGIALILYGIGTMLVGTQKKALVIVGLVLNIITIVLSLVALIYERFGY
ncbi:MAG: hypothetical protein K1X72_09815 [Pyrinomonadaceae bacterium]|nr:hypothetical protein [Pyrinomonadaceae bacterium]